MMAINPVFVVIMAESLAALLLLFVGILFFRRRKKGHENATAEALISQLEETEAIRCKKLGLMLAEHCQLDEQAVQDYIREINQQEKSLYQQIIQMFLSRDPELLKEVDQSIHNLSEPYCKILLHKHNSETLPASDADVFQQGKKAINQLRQENDRLAEQLQTAMNTMDEISSEYTRMFNGTKSEIELQNSCQKMLAIFQEALSRVQKTLKSPLQQ